MREVDIAKEHCVSRGETSIEIDGIFMDYGIWFDADKYFGTKTQFENDTWIEFYTYWNPKDGIRAYYNISRSFDLESIDWDLTEEEKDFFYDMMERACKQDYGMSMEDLWKRWGYDD